MYTNIFISYVAEDLAIAEKIYEKLNNGWYKPWMDKKHLLPGHNWDMEIRAALKRADFIIILLSKNSVNKRGYYQREFKLALEYCEEKLANDIYIIPIKIDDCEIPEELKKYQWIEVKNSEIPFEAIYRAINTQAEKYREADIKRFESGLSYKLTASQVKKTISLNLKSECLLEINFPQFISTGSENIELLNSFIKSSIFKPYLDYTRDLFKITNEPPSGYGYYAIEIGFKVEVLTNDFFSFFIDTRKVIDNASLYKVIGCNYKLNPLFDYSIRDLFDNKIEVLSIIGSQCKKQFSEQVQESNNEENSFYKKSFYDVIKNPDWSLFENFFMKRSSIVIILFIENLPAIFAGKQMFIDIPYDEFLTLQSELKTFNYTIRNIQS